MRQSSGDRRLETEIAAEFDQAEAGILRGMFAHTLLTHPGTIVSPVATPSKLGFLALLLLLPERNTPCFIEDSCDWRQKPTLGVGW